MENEKIKELEAMLVVLAKKVEKLEGTSRIANASSYLNELKKEAAKLLQFWS